MEKSHARVWTDADKKANSISRTKFFLQSFVERQNIRSIQIDPKNSLGCLAAPKKEILPIFPFPVGRTQRSVQQCMRPAVIRGDVKKKKKGMSTPSSPPA